MVVLAIADATFFPFPTTFSFLASPNGYFAAFILSLIAIRSLPKSVGRILYWLYASLALFLGLDEISFGYEYGWFEPVNLKNVDHAFADVHNFLQPYAMDIVRAFGDQSLSEELLVPFLAFNLGLIVLGFALVIGLRNFGEKASQIKFTFLIWLSGAISFWALFTLAALPADPKNAFIFVFSFQRLLPMRALLGFGLMAFGFALISTIRNRTKDVETNTICLEQLIEDSISEEEAKDLAEPLIGQGYFYLSTIAALISLLWLILIPADPKNALLFGYSITRLAMIVVGASILLLFIRGLQKSLNDRDWYSTLSIRLHNLFAVKMRLWFSLILALVGLTAGTTFIIVALTQRDPSIQVFLARLAPWGFLGLVMFAQLLYYVLRIRMKDVMKDVEEWLNRWWHWIAMLTLVGLAAGLLFQFLLITNVDAKYLARNALFAPLLHWSMLQLTLLMSSILLQRPSGSYGVIEIPSRLLYWFANTPAALFVIGALTLVGFAQLLDVHVISVSHFFERSNLRVNNWNMAIEEFLETAGGILMAIGTFYFPKRN